MDSGYRQLPRTTATTVAAPQTSVPSPRNAPAVESAAPDVTPVDTAGLDTATVATGPIPVVPAARPGGTAGRGAGAGVVTAPAVGAPADPLTDTGPIAVVDAGDAPVVDPPMPTAVAHPCRCGHDRDAHEHFRPGTDCAGCGCGRFRKPGLLARLRG